MQSSKSISSAKPKKCCKICDENVQIILSSHSIEKHTARGAQKVLCIGERENEPSANQSRTIFATLEEGI